MDSKRESLWKKIKEGMALCLIGFQFSLTTLSFAHSEEIFIPNFQKVNEIL